MPQTTGGGLFPTDFDANDPPDRQWPVVVFQLKNLPDPPSIYREPYMPKVMLCPIDDPPTLEVFRGEPGRGVDAIAPGQKNVHSYIVSRNTRFFNVVYSRSNVAGLTSGEFIIAAEKRAWTASFFFGQRPPDGMGDDESWYAAALDFYHHGRIGSNYLFLDLHVQPLATPKEALHGIDPWKF